MARFQSMDRASLIVGILPSVIKVDQIYNVLRKEKRLPTPEEQVIDLWFSFLLYLLTNDDY